MERAVSGGNIRVCAVCNKKVKEEKLREIRVDGLWVCSSKCMSKFLKEKKKWPPEEWVELCKMQALYEERKRAEISTARK